MINRLKKADAAQYIGCSISKLSSMERAGLMKGTFYEIGCGKSRRRLYITERLDEWILSGGEPAAWERLAKEENRFPFALTKCQEVI